MERSQKKADNATKKIIEINDSEVRGHLRELVRGSVEETLNGLLDAEADALCGAKRYERNPERVDTAMSSRMCRAKRSDDPSEMIAITSGCKNKWMPGVEKESHGPNFNL